MAGTADFYKVMARKSDGGRRGISVSSAECPQTPPASQRACPKTRWA